jgi:ADP-ribosylglycohydrolase
MKGAWLGRAAGCTLGAPVELWPVERMERLAQQSGAAFPPEDYWPDHPNKDGVRYGASTVADYLRGSIKAVPVDDDLAYTILGLLILEEHGPEFTTADVAQAWLKYLPVACTAEEVALRNLKEGVDPSEAAVVDNPYQHWIGADIRSDPWGYACPGQPERAAAMAYQDAYLSHRQDGLYGAMLFSGAIAAAFALDDPIEAIEVGLTEIPKSCGLARDVKWALRAGESMTDHAQARAAVDKRFPGMHPVHTNNNACLTVFGLFLGEKDFTRTIGNVVAMGLDNDCTAATAGSLLGAVLGVDGIPGHWWKPFRNRCHTYLNGVPELKNTEVVERFLAAAGGC